MVGLLLAGIMLLTAACAPAKETEKGKTQDPSETETETEEQGVQMAEDTRYTVDTKIEDVIQDPVFGDYGRLIFPVESGYYSGDTLGNLKLTWYNNIDPDTTVNIVNRMKADVLQGNTIFYDIYSDAEKAADPAKENTGLFFFRGNPGEKFAVCNAGGAFAYVGAMQDSFPHALALSERGYNAFALIYRPGAQTACEDLSRALAFIFDHAEELQVDTDDYTLWGGSAGARMAAWVGRYGTEAFGERDLPKPAAVIMQYTGLNDYSEEDPPTFVTVGRNDGIADWRIMKQRLEAMSRLGIPTEFHSYPGLGHGFGVGTGTVAEGWLDQAVTFWENQSSNLREGTSKNTVATPDDFPAEYNYGTGKISDYSRNDMLRKLPAPSGEQTVLNTKADPEHIQALYLWEEGNVPAETEFTEEMTGYFDDWDFRPYVTAIPVRRGVQAKGAVVLMAGGAYQFRGNYTDALPTAAALREQGFQTFLVDYRLHPYTQEEGALDVARAVRFVRKNAEIYGIDPDAIAVMGFSAGGIQAGEFLMHYDGEVNGTALDADYIPDELDEIPAHASADGMIYSFYGRLSVGNMDPDWLAEGELPPTFYVYGTEDPFYSQFEKQYDVLRGMGIPVKRIVLNGWPHGFGADGGWVSDYGQWLTEVFHVSTDAEKEQGNQ